MIRKWYVIQIVVLTLAVTPSASLSRNLPPVVPPPAPVQIPAVRLETLPNGLRVAALKITSVPAVTLTLAIRSGAEFDPAQFPGTAQFVSSMLGEGTKNMTAEQIAAKIDGMGAVFNSTAEWDDSWASLTVLSDDSAEGFGLLSAIVTRAAFRNAEVSRIRRQTLSALAILRRDPDYLADTLIQREVFRGTPYGHPENGDEDSVERLPRSGIQAFYRRYYQPSNAILVIAGDLDTSRAFGLADEYFGTWRNSGEAIEPPRLLSVQPSSGRARVVVIDDPEAVQTEIRVANGAPNRTSSSYDALAIANQVLGGPAENWLFTVLRTRRGLVYGASSRVVSYRSAGAWEIKTSTETAETGTALRLILREMKRLDERPITADELSNAQDYLVGHMALQFQTSQQIAERVLDLLIYNLPLTTWNRKADAIRALTLRDVSSVTRAYLDPGGAVIVLVGNAAGFKNSLKGLGPVRVIPISDSDLGSPTLDLARRWPPAGTAETGPAAGP